MAGFNGIMELKSWKKLTFVALFMHIQKGMSGAVPLIYEYAVGWHAVPFKSSVHISIAEMTKHTIS